MLTSLDEFVVKSTVEVVSFVTLYTRISTNCLNSHALRSFNELSLKKFDLSN